MASDGIHLNGTDVSCENIAFCLKKILWINSSKVWITCWIVEWSNQPDLIKLINNKNSNAKPCVSCDTVEHLNKLRLKNINRLVIGNLNINSLPDKFDQLELPIKNKVDKGAYIKYVGGEAGGFYKFFKKYFIAQETIDLNISWPSDFFEKYFMASILVPYLRLACSSISG